MGHARTVSNCEVRVEGDQVTLGVSGELTLASAYPLLSALQRAAPLATRCAVDLHEVDAITPGGWEALGEVLASARSLFRAVFLDPPHASRLTPHA